MLRLGVHAQSSSNQVRGQHRKPFFALNFFASASKRLKHIGATKSNRTFFLLLQPTSLILQGPASWPTLEAFGNLIAEPLSRTDSRPSIRFIGWQGCSPYA